MWTRGSSRTAAANSASTGSSTVAVRPSSFGDHAQADVQAEGGLGQALHGSLGQAELGGPEAQRGVKPRSERAGRDALGQRAGSYSAAAGAGQAMDLVFDDDRTDRRDLGDLMAVGIGVGAVQSLTTPDAGGGHAGDGVGELVGGTRGRVARMWPVCPPRFLPEGVLGGCLLRWMGSVDGGFDELRELEPTRSLSA